MRSMKITEACTLFSKKKKYWTERRTIVLFQFQCYRNLYRNVQTWFTDCKQHAVWDCGQTANNTPCETVDPLKSKKANWLYFCVTLVPHFCATGQRKPRVTFSISSASFKGTIQRIRSARMAVLCNTRKKELRRQRTSRDFQKIHDKYSA